MKKYPIVAIVGRANVGKSSLFNAIVGAPQAVTAREAGTTRDSVQSVISYESRSFRLVDTAGFKNPEDEFEESIQEQVTEASHAADAIVVVVDASTIITEEDAMAAKMALKSQKAVILAINKVDQAHKKNLDTFYKLGIKHIVKTSATQRRGINELKKTITEHIPVIKEGPDHQDNTITVSIVGRPNLGKSHLFNALGEKQQAIVSSRAGTTRDINTLELSYHGQGIAIQDTAGIRKQSKISPGPEKFSVLRTIHAIENSDISVLMLDPHELVTNLDKKIAGMIKDAGKGLIICVNKWDLVEKDSTTQNRIGDMISHQLQFVWWAPLIFTSAKTGANVTKLFDLILEIYDQYTLNLPEEELKHVVHDLFAKHKPAASKRKKPPKLLDVTQSRTRPPEVKLYGHDISDVHWSFKRYIENGIREAFSIHGTPIQVRFFNQKEVK